MIGGVIKYFRFDFDYCLWEISYANLNMLLATIPIIDHDDEPGTKKTKTGEIEVESFEDLQDIFNE